MAPSNLDRPDFQRFFVDLEMDLAPDLPFVAAVIGGMPFTLALDLDPGAVDEQVQRSLGAAVADVHGSSFLAAAQRAEVGQRPVKASQPQRAFDELVVCRRAMPNRTFIERRVWRAASLLDRWRPRLIVSTECQLISRSNQIVSQPRRLRASLQGVGLLMHFS